MIGALLSNDFAISAMMILLYWKFASTSHHELGNTYMTDTDTDVLTSLNLPSLMRIASSACTRTGSLLAKPCNTWFDASSVAAKHDKDTKLQADIQAETCLVDALSDSNYPVLSEESSQKNALQHPVYWVVDPLDGTSNFQRGLPSCVCVALVVGKKPVLGAIYCVKNGDMYLGSVQHPATKNGKRVTVANARSVSQACLLTGPGDYGQGLSDMRRYFSAYKMVRVIGSAGVSCSLVADGTCDAYIEKARSLWDIAAGWALVEASGGVVFVQPSPLYGGTWDVVMASCIDAVAQPVTYSVGAEEGACATV